MSNEKHPVTLDLSDSNVKLLNRLMDLGVAKSNEIITRSTKYPSETIKSKETIKKHEIVIGEIEELRNHLNENTQW